MFFVYVLDKLRFVLTISGDWPKNCVDISNNEKGDFKLTG